MSETIINGIDVSECEKLGETIDGFTCGLGKRIRFANEIITKHNLCKDNPDCYFKQLKRLQEENEKLKENQCCPETCEYIATEIIRYTNVCEVNSKYKQALEKIRDIVKPIKDNTCFGMSCGAVDWILNEINEVLKDV